MGPKIRVVTVLMMLFVSLLLLSFQVEQGVSEGASSDLQDVDLYFHGDYPDNALLNTSRGDYEEHHVLTTNITDFPNQPILIGEWQTKPIEYPMKIEGEVKFIVYAMGDLGQVQFSAMLYANGVEISPEMTTNTADLNESWPMEFISTPVNASAVDLNTTDVITLRLTLQHNDPQYFIPPPLGTGGKNVTLVFGAGAGSFVEFPTDSIKIINVDGRDDPFSTNWLVTATIKCSFGTEDYRYAQAKSDYGSFSGRTDNFLDNATVEAEWSWNYNIDQGGSYPVEIRVDDRNFNRWKVEKNIHITTPETEIDFSITDSDISFDPDPEQGKNTTIKAKIKGSGRRWSSYQVEVEFYDGSEPIEKVKASIAKTSTNEVTVLWTPDKSGKHTISVEIDPDDDFSETDENNNEGGKTVDVKEKGGGDGTPGFESVFLIAAIGFAMFIAKRRR